MNFDQQNISACIVRLNVTPYLCTINVLRIDDPYYITRWFG